MILVVIRELLSKKFAVNLQAVYVLLLNITLSNNIIYDGELAGTITRNAKAFCCGPKLYFFEITFPAKATFEERMLLIAVLYIFLLTFSE